MSVDSILNPSLLNKTTRYKHFHRIAWLAVALASCVIVFGAFVRLSNAGLSCPDWPTCYGRATWPQSGADAAAHTASAIRPFETHKAWREQVHRMLAGGLGLIAFTLALVAARRRRFAGMQIITAAALVAVAIPLYMQGQHAFASACALSGESILLVTAVRCSNQDLSRVATLTLAVIIFQALLGMWTVAWLLKPIVVMGHLIGGMLTFALLTWMAWRATDLPIRIADAAPIRTALIGALALLALQIALGGWVSANYAALACANDFPTCVGRWWPPHDFSEGFVLWRGIGVDYEGGVLDGASRIAIQLAHRGTAVVLFLYLIGVSLKLMRMPGLRGWSTLLFAACCLQVALGVANVKLSLPIALAVAHNAGALLLLFVLMSLLSRIKTPD